MYCAAYCIVMYGCIAVWRCMALYCCIVLQWARDTETSLYCTIQHVLCCIAIQPTIQQYSSISTETAHEVDGGPSWHGHMGAWVGQSDCPHITHSQAHPGEHCQAQGRTNKEVRPPSATQYSLPPNTAGSAAIQRKNVLYWVIQRSLSVTRPL